MLDLRSFQMHIIIPYVIRAARVLRPFFSPFSSLVKKGRKGPIFSKEGEKSERAARVKFRDQVCPALLPAFLGPLRWRRREDRGGPVSFPFSISLSPPPTKIEGIESGCMREWVGGGKGPMQPQVEGASAEVALP